MYKAVIFEYRSYNYGLLTYFMNTVQPKNAQINSVKGVDLKSKSSLTKSSCKAYNIDRRCKHNVHVSLNN